jgi:trehalose synthase
MLHDVPVATAKCLDEYAALAPLTRAVAELRAEAGVLVPKLSGRTVWMVNSTAQGGGVAEMLPRMVQLMNEVGLDTRWVTINTEEQGFFSFTKQLHNLIHGSGEPRIDQENRLLYDKVSEELADEMRTRIAPGAVVVAHDPQPAGMVARLRQHDDIRAIWRCHIGLDQDTPQTQSAWGFLESYLEPYDHCVFTAPEYIPRYLSSSVSIIHPGIDPFSHKNRDLGTHKLVNVLCDAQLLPQYGPLLAPPFQEPARRLQPDGTFLPASVPEDIGLLFRPIITQISRWDRLKGWRPLLDAFTRMKHTLRRRVARHEGRDARTLELVRLVMAGPDPASIQDDPEAREVFEDISRAYRSLPDEIRQDVVVLSLPMVSLKENALMVNALQRCSTLVVQNSLREGFGLTATEAMWKRIPVVGSSACGLRQQIRHGLDGYLIQDAEDPDAIADSFEQLLTSEHEIDAYARAGQRRVYDEFLVFTQVRRWLRVLAAVVEERRHSSRPGTPTVS